MWLLTAKLPFNEPHARCLVSMPGIIREGIPPYQCDRKVITSICEGKKDENPSNSVPSHRKLIISSIASVHQDHVLLPASSSPAPCHLDLLLTKPMYPTRITRRKED
jgi:hypothetical protein